MATLVNETIPDAHIALVCLDLMSWRYGEFLILQQKPGCLGEKTMRKGFVTMLFRYKLSQTARENPERMCVGLPGTIRTLGGRIKISTVSCRRGNDRFLSVFGFLGLIDCLAPLNCEDAVLLQTRGG